MDRGEAEEALPHCQEAVRLQPDTASLHHNLGNVLRVLERYVDARAAYLEALRIDPNLALAQAHLGLILQREGKLGDALPWLEAATELEPANASFWEWLAELYDEREEPGDSIPCWQRVLALGPERPGRTSPWAGRCKKKAGWTRPPALPRRARVPARRRPWRI